MEWPQRVREESSSDEASLSCGGRPESLLGPRCRRAGAARGEQSSFSLLVNRTRDVMSSSATLFELYATSVCIDSGFSHTQGGSRRTNE